MKKPVQHNNEVQFARLLCEIVATQETLDTAALKESMDLSSESDLQELFDRAHDVWEKSKSENAPTVRIEGRLQVLMPLEHIKVEVPIK
jgi:hypothetical protein